jgi:hypothetical protein
MALFAVSDHGSLLLRASVIILSIELQRIIAAPPLKNEYVKDLFGAH